MPLDDLKKRERNADAFIRDLRQRSSAARAHGRRPAPIGRQDARMITDSLRVRLGMKRRRYKTMAQRVALKAKLRNASDERPSRPVFVLGCPRSGTSLVYTLLQRHPELRSLGGEGHVLWNAYQHPRLKGWSSDRALASDIHDEEPRFLYSAINAVAGPHRFLEKTPKNILRVPYLNALFPDARYLLLKRDGRAVVNSLIEGWEVRQSPVYRLPEPLRLRDYRGRLWCFILPPDWRAYAETSIADIAAFQFASSYDVGLADVKALPSASVVELRFEALLERPLEEMARVLEALELPPSMKIDEMAGDLVSNVVQSNSPPRPDKWRQREDVINEVMPRFEHTMTALGYGDAVDVDRSAAQAPNQTL